MSQYPTKSFTIKQWAEDDKPREKLLLKGRSSLSDAELIAILLATGTKEVSAVDLAKKVLQLADNNLADLGKLTVNDLKKIKGIGEAKAITIIAALELGRRRKETESRTMQKITSSKDIYSVFEPLLSDLPHEEFWVLLLSRSSKIIGYKRMSEGGVSGTVADVKIIMKYAIENLASLIVLCHNHPSGSLDPSFQDKDLTKKIQSAALLLDMQCVDHIIVGQNGYFSFTDSESF